MSAENEEVVPPVRKSIVTVGVKRLLNTAQFENLEVKLESQEEVSWTTLAERARKIDSITTLLNDQYTKTQTAVLGHLGIEEKRAWRKNKPQSNVAVGDELDS